MGLAHMIHYEFFKVNSFCTQSFKITKLFFVISSFLLKKDEKKQQTHKTNGHNESKNKINLRMISVLK